MKGQAQITAAIGTVILVASMLIVGIIVYGYVSDIAPHDQVISNESMCTTCVNGSGGGATRYEFDNLPVLNDTTMVCFNDSADLMTNGVGDSETCLGYNIEHYQYMNITNTSEDTFCQITDVVCTYTYDQASANEQSFFNTNTANSYAGFAVATVIVIVLAAVALLFVVMLLKG